MQAAFIYLAVYAAISLLLTTYISMEAGIFIPMPDAEIETLMFASLISAGLMAREEDWKKSRAILESLQVLAISGVAATISAFVLAYLLDFDSKFYPIGNPDVSVALFAGTMFLLFMFGFGLMTRFDSK